MPGSSPQFDVDRLAAACRRFQLRELCIFGSGARGDLGPDSDIDVLVEFAPGADPSLLDLARLREALADVFGRPVDLVDGRDSLVNPIRRDMILASLRQVYRAA